MQKFDFIIIGYGLTGMTAANLLAVYGYKVAVLEKNKQLYDIPRAIHLDDEIMRIFQFLGIEKEVLAICKPVKGMQLLDKNEKLLLQTTKKALGGFEASYLFFQPDLEKILDKNLQKYKNVQIFWEHELLDLQTEKSIKTTILDKKSGKEIFFEADFLWACDGSNSAVRKIMQIPLQSLFFEAKNLKIDVQIAQEENNSEWIQKICLPDFPFVRLHAFQKHARWEFSVKKGFVLDQKKLDFFLQKTGIKNYQILHTALYHFKSQYAQIWQKNHVFLLGDAAHQMPPYIGQGACAGIRDAFNLAWKTDWFLKNRLSEKLLESYFVERKNHVQKVIFLTNLIGVLFAKKFSFLLYGLRFLPKKYRKIAVPPLQIGSGFFGKRYGGHIFPKENGTDVHFEKKWVLLANFEPKEKEKKCLENVGIQILEASKVAFFETWLSKNRADFVLIRPDCYIFEADKKAVFEKMLGRLQIFI